MTVCKSPRIVALSALLVCACDKETLFECCNDDNQPLSSDRTER